MAVVSSALLVADPIPTPYFTSFYDNATTYNGLPVPVGSVIEAFDPNNVNCGKFIVGSVVDSAGVYGFMPTYGDDPSSPLIDEGALLGQTITFKINGRAATVNSGDNTWQDQTQKQVSLSASGTVGIASVTFPNDTIGAPGWTIRCVVQVQNTGDGLDFYRATATTLSSMGTPWTTTPQANLVYANPGAQADIYFDVELPVFPGVDDTTGIVTFYVASQIDTSKKVGSTVIIYLSVTDVGDDDGNLLPKAFALYQNYPNPFNPTTTIGFALSSRSEVSVQIYDVLGRTVESIDLGTRSAGTHDIEYDASHLSSGVYYYRVITELGSETKKMVLLK
jgi:Secretion system C-terminal sorting domain